MLATLRDKVAALIRDGKTLEQAIAATPTKDLDRVVGQGLSQARAGRADGLHGPEANGEVGAGEGGRRGQLSVTWLLYGANGYTGELIAREAATRGMRPILAGRNAAAVERLANELGCEARCVRAR